MTVEVETEKVENELGSPCADVIAEILVDEVHEQGTTAAAATAIGESATSVEGVRIVQIDRPFRYFIRDRESNAIPFIGHIADPTVTAAL